MRWICGASALLAVCSLMGPAVGQEAPWGGGLACPNCEQYYTLGAPACASPFLGWVPGCYECPPSACDNAWATYCHEKAKWKAFWHRVGTGAFCDRRAMVVYQPTPAIYRPTMYAPPTAPLPEDVLDERVEPLRPREDPLPPTPAAGDLLDERLEPVGPVEPEEPIRLPPVPEPLPDRTTWQPNGPGRR